MIGKPGSLLAASFGILGFSCFLGSCQSVIYPEYLVRSAPPSLDKESASPMNALCRGRIRINLPPGWRYLPPEESENREIFRFASPQGIFTGSTRFYPEASLSDIMDGSALFPEQEASQNILQRIQETRTETGQALIAHETLWLGNGDSPPSESPEGKNTRTRLTLFHITEQGIYAAAAQGPTEQTTRRIHEIVNLLHTVRILPQPREYRQDDDNLLNFWTLGSSSWRWERDFPDGFGLTNRKESSESAPPGPPLTVTVRRMTPETDSNREGGTPAPADEPADEGVSLQLGYRERAVQARLEQGVLRFVYPESQPPVQITIQFSEDLHGTSADGVLQNPRLIDLFSRYLRVYRAGQEVTP